MKPQQLLAAALLSAILYFGGCALKVVNTCPAFAVEVEAGGREFQVAAGSTSDPVRFLAQTIQVTGRDPANPGFEDTITVDLQPGEVVCLEWDGVQWSIIGSESMLQGQ